MSTFCSRGYSNGAGLGRSEGRPGSGSKPTKLCSNFRRRFRKKRRVPWMRLHGFSRRPCQNVAPHDGVRPFYQKSTCLTLSTEGPNVVQIWSRDTLESGSNKTLVLHRVVRLWEHVFLLCPTEPSLGITTFQAGSAVKIKRPSKFKYI